MKREVLRAYLSSRALGVAIVVAVCSMMLAALYAAAGRDYQTVSVGDFISIASTGRVPLVLVNGHVEPLPATDFINSAGGYSGLPVTTCGAGSAVTSISTTGAGTCGAAGGASVDPLAFTPQLDGVFSTGGAQLNNWNPTNLATKTVIEVQAGDNVGTLITGIDAIDNSIATGSTRIICNTAGPADDGVIALSNEDTSSLANNRILTPGGGKVASALEDRAVIGPSHCLQLVYLQPDQSDPTNKRWVIVGDHGRGGRVVIQNLELFPWSTPAAITSGTSVNDWSPVDTCPQVGGAAGGNCEAGSSTQFNDYAIIKVATSAAGSVTITGMTGPGGNTGKGEGTVKCLLNAGPGQVNLSANNVSSAAANRFNTPDGVDLQLQVGEMRCFWTAGSTWTPWGAPVGMHGVNNNVIPKGVAATGGNNATMTLGASAISDSGTQTSVGSLTVQDSASQTAASAVTVTPTGTALTSSSGYDLALSDARTFNTTGGTLTAGGLSLSMTAARSSGANNLTNVALAIASSGAQVNYAIQTTVGAIYFGLGGAGAQFYFNPTFSDFATRTVVEGDFQVGGGDFVAHTTAHIKTVGSTVSFTSCGTGPACNSTTCNDVAGTFTTGSGATTCTVTFAATYTGADDATCIVQTMGSATMPTFTTSATAITMSVSVASTKYHYICLGH